MNNQQDNPNNYIEPDTQENSLFLKITIAVVLLFVTVVGISLLLLERPTISESEKRELAVFPTFTTESYFTGEYFLGISTFYTDTVPYREDILTTTSKLNDLMGVTYMTFYGGTNILDDQDFDEKEYKVDILLPPEDTSSSSDSSDSTIDPSSQVTDTDIADTDNDDVETDDADVTDSSDDTQEDDSEEESRDTEDTTADSENTDEQPAQDTTPTTETTEPQGEILDITMFSNNGIVVDGVTMYDNTAGVMLFGSSNSAGQYYADVLNAYQVQLGSDVQIYNLLIPTSAEFYLPSRFSRYSSSQKDSIDYIYSLLSDDIITIDAYSALANHTDEYIYARTDHHWMQLGAYYAYTAFSQALGQSYPAIEEYEMRSKENFVGSLYTYTNDNRLYNSPEIFNYYMPPNVAYIVNSYDYNTLQFKHQTNLYHEYASGGNTYSMFLGGDNLHLKIDTSIKNGRSIAVFKESFGNAFIPFLVNNFETVYVIDIRYFGPSAVQYIKDQQITDVLFLNNIFAANTHSLIRYIDNLRY